MNKRLDEYLSDVFVKPEAGLDTELFVIGELDLGRNAEKRLKAKYTPNEKFKLMRREYNIAPENIVKPIALRKVNGKDSYILERVNGDMFIDSLYRVRKNEQLLCSIRQQLKETVEKLHSNGYVHGDLRGANNIMLTKEGKIKLIDPLYIPKNFEYKEAFIELDNNAVKSVINLMYTKFMSR